MTLIKRSRKCRLLRIADTDQAIVFYLRQQTINKQRCGFCINKNSLTLNISDVQSNILVFPNSILGGGNG